jgi:mono/diheme cytochrome c family protein
MGSCISCHNIGDNGGVVAQRPWSLISMFAVSSPDYFRKYVVNPTKVNPMAKMPAHPNFDDKTLDALQAYFRSIAPH